MNLMPPPAGLGKCRWYPNPTACPNFSAFDSKGNLYFSDYRVRPDRHVDLVCQDVENLLLCQPTNCAFGGRLRPAFRGQPRPGSYFSARPED